METKLGASVEAAGGKVLCPPLLDVALCESGELQSAARAWVHAHARECLRCESALRELSQARDEILGDTSASQSQRSQAAAQAIQAILLRRFH